MNNTFSNNESKYINKYIMLGFIRTITEITLIAKNDVSQKTDQLHFSSLNET